jgi:hypothetical protein
VIPQKAQCAYPLTFCLLSYTAGCPVPTYGSLYAAVHERSWCVTACVPPLQANGVCQRSMNGACQLQEAPANCSAATNPEDKAMCDLVATVKSAATIPGGVRTIADNMCTSK